MEEIIRAAALAKLELNEEEKLKSASALKQMLDFFRILKEADVSAVPEDDDLVTYDELRADEAADGGMSTAITAAAPETDDGMFVVPKTV